MRDAVSIDDLADEVQQLQKCKQMLAAGCAILSAGSKIESIEKDSEWHKLSLELLSECKK